MRTDHDDTRTEFLDAVNMTGRELQHWLDSDESQSVGVSAGGEKKSEPGGEESIGHESGRRILALLHADASDLDDEDYAHMRKVVGYIHRHRAQQPGKEPLETSRWRYSLMNWGYDPLKT